MKLGLISDVHGDIDALERAWALLRELGADKVVSAGDSVGYGPEPDRVIAFLIEHEIEAVRGNHDRWALERGLGEREEFGGGMVGRDAFAFLEGLPFDRLVTDGARVVLVVHGSPRSDMEFVNPRTHPGPILRGYLEMTGADVLVVGHTHRPFVYRCDRGLVINPGSVIGRPVVETSQSFALVDLADLSATAYSIETGRPIALPPSPEASEPVP